MSFHEELESVSCNAPGVSEGKIYEHYKGKRYQILSLAKHSETLEENVVYRALYGDRHVWVRPLKMFSEKVFVDGILRPRFREVK